MAFRTLSDSVRLIVWSLISRMLLPHLWPKKIVSSFGCHLREIFATSAKMFLF